MDIFRTAILFAANGLMANTQDSNLKGCWITLFKTLQHFQILLNL